MQEAERRTLGVGLEPVVDVLAEVADEAVDEEGVAADLGVAVPVGEGDEGVGGEHGRRAGRGGAEGARGGRGGDGPGDGGGGDRAGDGPAALRSALGECTRGGEEAGARRTSAGSTLT